VEVREVPVDGGSIAIELAGAGTPLVLLHGWALDRSAWRPQLDRLSDRFSLIAVDRRGFGASSAPPDLARELDDLVAIQSALGLERMLLVGMSQGGRVALHFAQAHPDRLIGLVLQGAPLEGLQPEPKGRDAIPLDAYAALLRDGRLDAMKAQWQAHPLMRAGGALSADDLADLLESYEGRDLLAGSAHGLAPIADELASISVPTLAITGEHDADWRQLAADAIAYGLPNARRITLPGGQHLCNLTHPEEYNRLLREFADEVFPSRHRKG
jgi:pimeloyl-ACP methyl ester carboxylesterase